ncbi:hypothetical protein [Nocardia sp. AG03]|uniref:hypothetical protein n=1 Tax=Nocardia sp. AG03 TaxID=3025312 RepID=UPI0024181588|nr:hypothetical protein [Nocardia sp. AG03]
MDAESTSLDSSAQEKPSNPSIDEVESFADFLRYLHGLDQDFKPVELAKSAPARLALSKPTGFDQLDEVVTDIAARDTKLATALALLLTAERSDLRGTARQTITALAARITQRHPAFIDDSAFETRLSRLIGGDLEPEALPQSITRMQHRLEQNFDGKRSMTRPALQSLSDNAAHVLVLLAASAANWDLAQCVDAFADTIWDAKAPFVDAAPSREKLATLPKTARKAVALVVQSARGQLRSVEAERDQHSHHLDIARAEIEHAVAALSTAESRATELEAELSKVKAALQQETEARRSERMGATSDFEILRVDTARAITQQIESLEDALDALRHGQTQITEEFVGRSVKNLRRSLTTLQPPSTKAAREDQS